MERSVSLVDLFGDDSDDSDATVDLSSVPGNATNKRKSNEICVIDSDSSDADRSAANQSLSKSSSLLSKSKSAMSVSKQNTQNKSLLHSISDSDSDTMEPSLINKNKFNDSSLKIGESSLKRKVDDSDGPKLSLKKTHEIVDSVSVREPPSKRKAVELDDMKINKNIVDTPKNKADCHGTQLKNATQLKSSPNSSSGNTKSVELPVCQWGKNCYRKNPSHFAEFQHPDGALNKNTEENVVTKAATSVNDDKKSTKCQQSTSTNASTSGYKCGDDIVSHCQPLSFLLTTVTGIDSRHNANMAIGIRDLLSLGPLVRSAQFNYCIDIPWVVSQYPTQFRSKPLLIVHGSQRQEKATLDHAALQFSHVRLCQAPLDIAYGTHHTKMMLLLYENGLRVVIHTANLINGDWFQKTQGVWVSPLFEKLEKESATVGDSSTEFKKDLLQYLSAYKRHQLDEWLGIIKQHDLSTAKVFLIGSVPGRHSGEQMKCFGHLKMKKTLQRYGPDLSAVSNWSVIGQFSSVGSLGNSADAWMTGELLDSLSAGKGISNKAKLQLIFPSKDNVRLSLEGYMAGGSIPYSIHTARKQPFFNSFLHQWKSDWRGRSRASPHIKTYTRVSPDSKELAWFLVTSSNLSKAAWGCLEKNSSQLMIRSYELGVLFIPDLFSSCSTFSAPFNCANKNRMEFPVPYDLPLTPYSTQDRPWIWDISYNDKPDSHGNRWSPN